MRNLNQELLNLGLNAIQSKAVLNWIDTLSPQDLYDNGNQNIYFPPGDGDYEREHLPDDYHLLENQIDRWIDENIANYREMHKNPEVSGRIQFVKSIIKEFNLTLVEAKKHLDKNW